MKKSGEKSICIAELQNQILQWQGFKQVERKHDGLGLGELEQAFPGNVFPVGLYMSLSVEIKKRKQRRAVFSVVYCLF